MALRPGSPACRAGTLDPGTADPGTPDPGATNPGDVIIGAVVTAAPLLSTASEVQLLADPIKQRRHAWGLSFGKSLLENTFQIWD